MWGKGRIQAGACFEMYVGSIFVLDKYKARSCTRVKGSRSKRFFDIVVLSHTRLFLQQIERAGGQTLCQYNNHPSNSYFENKFTFGYTATVATPTLLQYAGIPADQRPPAQDVIFQALRNFVNVVPLDPTHVNDLQPHPNAYQKHGTLVLPLWQQNTTMNSNSPHWQAYNTLLDTLAIGSLTAALALEAMMPDEYARAMAISRTRRATLATNQQVSTENDMDCFESFRLNVNLSLDWAHPTTSHPSQWVVVMAFGNFSGGELRPAMGDQELPRLSLKPGGVTIMRTAAQIKTSLFDGERYQVEFYLPDLGGN